MCRWGGKLHLWCYLLRINCQHTCYSTVTVEHNCNLPTWPTLTPLLLLNLSKPPLIVVGWNSLAIQYVTAFGFIPLRAKRVGEVIEIRHKKIHPSIIWVPLGVCHSVTLRPINPQLSQQPAMGLGQKKIFRSDWAKKYFTNFFFLQPVLSRPSTTDQKSPYIFLKTFLGHFLHLKLLEKTQGLVPQVLKQVVNLSCYKWPILS